MPGWYEKTQAERKSGKIQHVGLIQEQHPDRCKLFMQWKQLDFPVLVDSFNFFGCDAVPLLYGIDEDGRVWGAIRREEGYRAFLASTPEPSDRVQVVCGTSMMVTRVIQQKLLDAASSLQAGDSAAKLFAFLESLLNVPNPDGKPTEKINFWRGVLYRMRHDSPLREAGDFAAAVCDWQAALDANPDQYIWRRRIEQYGPRMAKPYPFYNWVDVARREILARGETPVPLKVEPGAAELAEPARGFESIAVTESQDAAQSVERDARLLQVDVAVVPAVVKAGNAARVYVSLEPNAEVKAQWNNESFAPKLWIEPPDGWKCTSQVSGLPPSADAASDATSGESRLREFEVLVPPSTKAGKHEFSAYILANFCEGASDVCLYRRVDFTITIDVRD